MSRITEINVAEPEGDPPRADRRRREHKVAKTFTDELKAKALGQDVLRSVKPGQMMTKIVRDELAALMGGTATDIRLEGTPAVVLIAGLQGSGKTTFSGKLANLIKSKKGRQVLLVAGDVYRPAAIDQLKILGQQVGVEVYTEEGTMSGADRRERGPLCPGEPYQYGDRRYGGPFGRRRADDAGRSRRSSGPFRQARRCSSSTR